MKAVGYLITLFALSTLAFAQPLQERGLANLETYTRLLGYVYYFHPSDAIAETEWQAWSALAAKNIDRVEEAATPEELARTLTDIVEPYAPTIQIYPTGTEPKPVSVSSEGASRVIFWLHAPSDDRTSGSDFRRGRRVVFPLDDGEVPKRVKIYTETEVPNPNEPYVVDLPGGITAAIPLALYADEEGALPHTETPAPLTLPEGSPGSNRAVRLATVMRAWNTLQHFFPYWEVIDTDWQAALHVALQEAATDENGKEFLITLQHLTNKLRDGHSSTYHAIISTDPRYRVPFTAAVIEDKVVVTTVAENQLTQLEPGDIISEIEGRPAPEALARMEQRISAVGQLGRYRALRYLLSNTSGAPITFEIIPHDGGEAYILEAPTSQRTLTHLREYRPPVVAQLAPGIMYVDLTRIYSDQMRVSDTQVEAVLAQLQDAEGIVFDMRGYPNGFANTLLNYLSTKRLSTAPMFDPVITRPDHLATQFVDSSWTISQPASADEQLTDNIAFIINGNGTVSYAELIMGVIEGYDLGERVGQPTGGVMGEVVTLPLPGGPQKYGLSYGYYTSWTIHKVTKFDGSPLFTVGITPTIPAERTIEGVAAKRDELLEKAFEVVSGQPASTMEIQPVPLD